MIQIALNDDRRPPGTRPLTPVRPPRSRLSALSALLAAITCGCLFCIYEVMADTGDWSSISDIVDNQDGSIPYNTVNSTSLPNQLTAICYILDSEGGSYEVGGFDMVNGQVTQSYFNSMNLPTTIGLTQGDTANTGVGANSQNAYGAVHK